jgi:hypothetical protein
MFKEGEVSRFGANILTSVKWVESIVIWNIIKFAES